MCRGLRLFGRHRAIPIPTRTSVAGEGAVGQGGGGAFNGRSSPWPRTTRCCGSPTGNRRTARGARSPPIVEIGEQRQRSTRTATDTIRSFASFRPTYNLLGMGEYQLASKTPSDSRKRGNPNEQMNFCDFFPRLRENRAVYL